MGRLLTLGNGKILVGLDNKAQVRDFYFPYVGLENHVRGHHMHRVGVWVDGVLNWTTDSAWETTTDCKAKVHSCNIILTNTNLGVRLEFNDTVYNEKNIFIRQISVTNLRKEKRKIKIFFGQQFRISETRRGDTAYFDPRSQSIIHYKGRRVFLINAQCNERTFDDYSVGLFEIEGKEGTHVDARDGELTKNPIEHGSADSVIGITLDLKGDEKNIVYYWIAAAESIQEAHDLNTYLLEKTPKHIIKTTKDFWAAWISRREFDFQDLDKKTIRLFNHSLLTIRTHTDDNGAIIASSDSSMLQYGRGTYSYVWPRDGAFTAIALNRIGSYNVGRRFFEFCNKVVTEEGYFMHKYRPDGSLGSSWHPWVRDDNPELPIQEDETAMVIYSLWDHYEVTKDLEFIESVYNSLIEKSADFLVHFTYKDTGLPYPSYDLWEEKYGISTFTCSSVYGALIAAAKFAELLGKNDKKELYETTALRMKEAILTYLYDDKEKMFYKLINFTSEGITYDKTLDMSSFYGIFKFDVLDIEDKRMQDFAKTIEDRLSQKTGISGIPRYESDDYYRLAKNMPANPWFLTTFWMAQFYIKEAKNDKDLDIVRETFKWVGKYSLPTGVLSEQLNPYTGDQISAAPLTWSHSEFIVTVMDYLEKLEELGISKKAK